MPAEGKRTIEEVMEEGNHDYQRDFMASYWDGGYSSYMLFHEAILPFPFFYFIRLVLAQALESNMTTLELPHSDTGVAETSHLSCVGDTNFALEGRMREAVTRWMEWTMLDIVHLSL